MANPLLFISHKHDDKDIAKEVAEFVRTITGGSVDVFLSSDPDFEGPRVGKPLNQELKDALWRAGVVILIYTSQDKDWSYCMWECGLADDANSPDTKVVVLQCLPDKPQVFEGGVRVTAWDEDSLVNLSYRFLEPDFFPRADRQVTGLKEAELKKRALQLHADLAEVIPTEPPENWSTWAFMRLELARESVEALHAAPEGSRLDAAHELLLSEATVADASSGLAQLFGRVDVSPKTPFKDLVDQWTESYPDRDPGWVRVLAGQVLEGSRKRTPKVSSWAPFREVEGTNESVVGVGRVKKDGTTFQFDCTFFGLGSVAGVQSFMTRRDKMYHIDLSKKAPAEVVLVDLLKELENNGWTRVPILDGKEAKYIAHVSMIDRFLRVAAIEGKDISALTLENILADEEMETMFASTFGLVEATKTIADALATMRDTKRCEDVFVTNADEGVVGWLTDRDIPMDALRTL